MSGSKEILPPDTRMIHAAQAHTGRYVRRAGTSARILYLPEKLIDFRESTCKAVSLAKGGLVKCPA